MLTSTDNASATTAAPATKGNLVTPAISLEVQQIFAFLDPAGGSTWKAMILGLDGNDIDQILFDGPAFAFASTGHIPVIWLVDPPLILSPAIRYALAIVRTDGTSSSALRMRSSTTFLQGWPGDELQGRFTLVSLDPQLGDTITDVTGSGIYGVNLVYDV